METPNPSNQRRQALLTFGSLLTALRYEQRNANDMPWSYKDLSVATGINVATLRKMTAAGTIYGAKSVDPEHLLLLANVFGLSSSERREFYLLGQGIPQEWAVKTRSSYTEAKQISAKMLMESRVPVLVFNQFSDNIQVNRYAATLYSFDERKDMPIAVEGVQHPLANNALGRIFMPNGLIRQLMNFSDWEEFALRNVIVFRSWSLHFRADPRYQIIKSALWGLPDFARLWLKATESNDHDSMEEVYKLNMTHPQLGLISFNILFTRIYSDKDVLFIGHYLPLNATTFRLFGHLQNTSRAECIDLEAMLMTQ